MSRNLCRLSIEPLEDRLALANVLVISYDADDHTAPFRNSFINPNSFLDWDRNGDVDNADITLFAGGINARVAAHLAPYDIEIVSGDLWIDTRFESVRLAQGQASVVDQVFVANVGGRWSWALGAAPQAPYGSAYEANSWCYFENIRRWYRDYFPAAVPEEVAQRAADVIVHELGHLIGLGHHVDGSDYVPIRNEWKSAELYDGWRWYVGQQNPHQVFIARLGLDG